MMPADHPIHETLRLLDQLDAAIASLPDRRKVEPVEDIPGYVIERGEV